MKKEEQKPVYEQSIRHTFAGAKSYILVVSKVKGSCLFMLQEKDTLFAMAWPALVCLAYAFLRANRALLTTKSSL